MMTAPIAATLTSRSMPITLVIKARTALMTIGVPATMAAASMAMSPTCAASKSPEAMKEAMINAPDTTGTAHFPFHQRCSLFISGYPFRFLPVWCVRRFGWWSEGGGVGGVACLGDSGDDVVDAGHSRVVVDLDAG